MPASVATATSAPPRSSAISSGTRRFSFPSKNETRRLRSIPRCWSSRPVLRVSSHAMRSTAPRTRRARSVTSSRLPIGVPTTHSVPGTLAASVLAAKLGPEVRLEGLAHRRHPQLVGEHAVVELERPLHPRDLLGRPGQPDQCGPDLDPPAADRSLLDLGDARGMGQHDLEPSPANGPPVAHLGVPELAIVQRPRALGVEEEGFADVPEPDLLAIGEGLDGRVLTLPLAAPRPQEKGDRLDLGMKRWCLVRAHRSNATTGRTLRTPARLSS